MKARPTFRKSSLRDPFCLQWSIEMATAKGQPRLGPSAHVDTFTRDNLPPFDQWPDLLLDRPEFQYPDRLNAAVELTDRMVERGFGDHVALIGNGRRRTYKELADWSNRLAHALVENYGVKPGNRVLIRSGNNLRSLRPGSPPPRRAQSSSTRCPCSVPASSARLST